MSKFKEYKFSALYKIDSGISTSKEQAGHGAPFLTFKDVFNNYFLPESLSSCMETSEKEQQIYSIKEGDIFLTRTSETLDELAMSSVATKDYPHATYSGFLKRLRPLQQDITYSKFMAFYLRSSYFRKIIDNNATMTLRASFNENVFSWLSLRLPSYEIQQKIGDMLWNFEQKMRLNNHVNATLEAMAKTLYDYWFVQFDFPDEKGRPYKTSGGKMVYNEELGREIPAGWEVLPLHDICTVISGYPFDSSLYDTDGDYHILTIKNIQNGYIVPQTDSNIHEIPNDIPAVDILKIGDILMSLTGNVGRVGILCGNNYLLNQRAAIVQPQFDNIKWFLYFMFRNSAICMQIQNISTGTSQKNVSPIDIGNIKIPYADRYMQNFNDTILSMVNTIIAKTVESQKLAVLRDWLLPMLMNGQVGFKGKSNE